MKIYQVGGAIRDRLLGRPIKDRDWVVVGATAADLERRGFRRIGKEFPVFLHPETQEEYALARRERKVGHGYRGFEVDTSPTVTLEEDLSRRDLTINAMAEDEAGVLIDPFGGRQDLEQGVLRHVSAAFVEDPVRVLRVARFAARYGFVVAQETLALMRAMVDSGELAALVPERVWAELERALSEVHAPFFFVVLRAAGALAVIFPEIEAWFCSAVPSDTRVPYTVGEQSLDALAEAVQLSEAGPVRFAALNIGYGIAFDNAGQASNAGSRKSQIEKSLRCFCDRLRVPSVYRELATIAAVNYSSCYAALLLRPRQILALFEVADAMRRPARFEAFLEACEANFISCARRREKIFDSQQTMSFLRSTLRAIRGIRVDEILKDASTSEARRECLATARIAIIRTTRQALARERKGRGIRP